MFIETVFSPLNARILELTHGSQASFAPCCLGAFGNVWRHLWLSQVGGGGWWGSWHLMGPWMLLKHPMVHRTAPTPNAGGAKVETPNLKCTINSTVQFGARSTGRWMARKDTYPVLWFLGLLPPFPGRLIWDTLGSK